ncbi:MAG: ATP-binding protein [Verrucomicrobiales bacterium]
MARTREAGGAGLGLAITKSCIESLKGRITASNRSEGGLSVLLKLPPS